MIPGSIAAPPCGAIASPQTVMMSDGARGGAVASSRRIQRRTCGSGAGAGERGWGRGTHDSALGNPGNVIQTLHYL